MSEHLQEVTRGALQGTWSEIIIASFDMAEAVAWHGHDFYCRGMALNIAWHQRPHIISEHRNRITEHHGTVTERMNFGAYKIHGINHNPNDG